MTEPSQKAKSVYAPDAAIHVVSHRVMQPIKRGQLWLLFRRVLVLVATIVYINNSLQGAFRAVGNLDGFIDNSVKFDPYQADYINSFAQPVKVNEGDLTTVGNGKLVNQILNGNLTPRVNKTLYLHSSVDASFDECSNWTTEATQRMYSGAVLRKLYTELVRDTANLVPELVGTEIVVPIVDCSFTALRIGNKADMRAFYLMRKNNSDALSDTFLLTFSLSMLDFRVPDLHQVGSAGLLIVSVVSDFTNDKVVHHHLITPGSPFRAASYFACNRLGVSNDGYLKLESIPTLATVSEPTKVYETSTRSGIYRKTEAEQGHFKNLYWEPSHNPPLALSGWEWRGTSIRRDSWAWVHGIQFLFAADACFNLLILLLVIYRNKVKGKVWIGDAFVSISKQAVIRALLVFLAWILNGFWTAHKFMLEEGNEMGGVTRLFVFPEIMHADLMIIYLGIVDLIGIVMCERIDPALSMLLFEIGFAKRRDLAKLFPSMADSIIIFARDDYAQGLSSVHPKLMAISPLRFVTTHEISSVGSTLGFTALFPVFSTLIFLLAYIPIRKVYRNYFPDQIVRNSRGYIPSNESEAVAWKSSLTIFEVATGAALQSRVGLVSDYDNCIYIKGLKFASADGIFCNGFVVANNKYLIRTGDLWLLFLMILTRVRFRDLYVYEIDGYTVQKMARLFYPEMMSLVDLLHLHSMILA